MIRPFVTIVFLLGSVSAVAESVDLPRLIMCKNQKVRRTIRVFKNSEGECETVYTKAGVDRTVGTASVPTSCFRFVDNIRENLEDAAWKCDEVSQFKIEFPQKTEE
ncbi:MAG: hypothetical protein R2827_15645 [Bdellovibrionales bacterium]